MIRMLNSYCSRFGRFRTIFVGLGFVFNAAGAMATLGQSPSLSMPRQSTLLVPAARQLAVKPETQNALFTVHERQMESGTMVREYANSAGLVFAVAWLGPVLPNLSDLLGDYFSSFMREADNARAMGKRGSSLNVDRSDLVVRSNGRMRSFSGHAYAPTLIPVGVSIQDVLQ